MPTRHGDSFPLPASIELIKSGKLRVLAVTTATRWEALPDIPTLGEFVPGYEASGWNGIGAPKSTPIEIILSDELAELIAEDTEKWAKVIKFAGIKPE
jgi:tripartite-type tricarboxylate transporter receptor subunit TctC